MQSLTIVKVRLVAVYAKGFTLEIIVSLAAGATRHLCVYTIALDFMLAITAPTNQSGGEIANEVVTALYFFCLQPFRLLLNRCRCEAPNCKCLQTVPYL